MTSHMAREKKKGMHSPYLIWAFKSYLSKREEVFGAFFELFFVLKNYFHRTVLISLKAKRLRKSMFFVVFKLFLIFHSQSI